MPGETETKENFIKNAIEIADPELSDSSSASEEDDVAKPQQQAREQELKSKGIKLNQVLMKDEEWREFFKELKESQTLTENQSASENTVPGTSPNIKECSTTKFDPSKYPPVLIHFGY